MFFSKIFFQIYFTNSFQQCFSNICWTNRKLFRRSLEYIITGIETFFDFLPSCRRHRVASVVVSIWQGISALPRHRIAKHLRTAIASSAPNCLRRRLNIAMHLRTAEAPSCKAAIVSSVPSRWRRRLNIAKHLRNTSKRDKNLQKLTKTIRRSKNIRPLSTIEHTKHNTTSPIMRGRRCNAAWRLQ